MTERIPAAGDIMMQDHQSDAAEQVSHCSDIENSFVSFSSAARTPFFNDSATLRGQSCFLP